AQQPAADDDAEDGGQGRVVRRQPGPDLGAQLMRALLLLCLLARADDPPTWTQAKPGEFPAANTAHEISGELIGLDHVNRTGTLRPDRNDSQRTDDYDVALPLTLLPFAKTMFHGAYAELRDVPIGTHLHGLFFVQDAPAKNQKPVFNRVLQ